eukprot:scaffold60108_cov73-Phaeocystis_antarctica.AAC.1
MTAHTHTGTLRPGPLSRGSLSRALSDRANGLNSLAQATELANTAARRTHCSQQRRAAQPVESDSFWLGAKPPCQWPREPPRGRHAARCLLCSSTPHCNNESFILFSLRSPRRSYFRPSVVVLRLAYKKTCTTSFTLTECRPRSSPGPAPRRAVSWPPLTSRRQGSAAVATAMAEGSGSAAAASAAVAAR